MTTRVTDILPPAGTHGSRPAATAVPAGSLYECTTHSLIYRSDGTAWATWAAVVPPGGSSTQVLTKNSGTDYDIAWAAGGSGGGSSILASMSYNPATAQVLAVPTTEADIDAANLAVTFTAPSTGNVIVPCGILAIGSSTQSASLTLRNGTTQLGIKRVVLGGIQVWVNPEFKVTGLTPGNSYTFKMGGVATGAGCSWGYGGTSGTILGAATMIVLSA